MNGGYRLTSVNNTFTLKIGYEFRLRISLLGSNIIISLLAFILIPLPEIIETSEFIAPNNEAPLVTSYFSKYKHWAV